MSRVPAPGRSGFTLLEVMVAVIILAVGLSSLFTSEIGAMRIAQRGRMTTIASLLARCKMGEVEEKVAKEGWPADVIEGDDKCCEGAEHAGFTCEWKVERIVLPELSMEEGEGAKDALDKLKGEGQDALSGAPSDPSAATPTSPAGPQDPAAAMGVPLGGAGSILDSVMGEGGGSGGADPIATFVMGLAFPVMKPIIEEQVRRATVIVNWDEGTSKQSLDVVQFLVNELPMLAPDDADEDEVTGGQGGASGSGSSGTTGSTGTSSTSTSSSGGKVQ